MLEGFRKDHLGLIGTARNNAGLGFIDAETRKARKFGNEGESGINKIEPFAGARSSAKAKLET